MSETDVVEKVSELMRTLDDVKRYRELAYAMVDLLAIMVVSAIAVILITFSQGVYDVVSGYPAYGIGLFDGIPTSESVSLVVIVVALAGILGGILWVDRRVRRTRTGEWAKTMEEGLPGAVKLLSDMDWESQLGMISTSRTAYLFYALLKVAGYSLLTYIVLLFVGGFSGLWYIVPSGPYLVIPISVVVVLIFSKKSLEAGFNRLRSLDLLFWDLRWFYSEFKRAEFNKA
jgi:uncharacterized membrane protein